MFPPQNLRIPSVESRPRQDDPVAGILTFIIADLVVFAFLFTGFMVERHKNLAIFNESSTHLNLSLGVINTLLLVTSGFFMVLANNAAREGSVGRFRLFLATTLFVGSGFGVTKVIEYSQKFSAGITMLTNDFYMFYFALTGVHFLHFLGGIAALIYLWVLSYRKPVDAGASNNIKSVGLYWHMVDLLWILIFPLLYILGTL